MALKKEIVDLQNKLDQYNILERNIHALEDEIVNINEIIENLGKTSVRDEMNGGSIFLYANNNNETISLCPRADDTNRILIFDIRLSVISHIREIYEEKLKQLSKSKKEYECEINHFMMEVKREDE